MKTMWRPGGLLVVVGVVGALAAGGIAYASIPDSSGVIHGCYATKDGSLRAIDPGAGGSCDAKKEKAVDWSQTGPQGPQGSQGAQGPQGPAGSSDVWSVNGYGSTKTVGGGPYVTVASAAVPAGSYVVEAEATLVDASSGTPVSCDLVDSTSFEYQAAFSTLASSSDQTVIPVQAVITLASPDTISLRCNGVDTFAQATYWKLAAIKVGSVH